MELRGPRVADLITMSLQADADAIRRLPDPEESFLVEAEIEQLAKATVRFRAMARDLLLHHDSLALSNTVTDESEFWSLFDPVIVYYGFGLCRCALDAELAEALGDFIAENPVDFDEDDEDNLPTYLDDGWGLLALHDTLILSLLTGARVDRLGFQCGELPERYDSDLTSVEALREFHHFYCQAGDRQRAQADRLLSQSLRFREEVLKRRYAFHRERADEGRSEIRGGELELLSARSRLMEEKYGPKRIERIFEQKLDLLFQSLGFTVIPARPGEAEADLLCIARQDRFTFLVDAKSTRGKYNLPKTDQRALEEYVGGFSEKLPDLPELSFVLLAGHDVASTVPGKLRSLERRLGLPARFVPARVLGQLAEELRGPVSGAVLREAILSSDYIVSDKVIEEMRSAFDSIASAYADFVAKLRSVSAVG
jgi:hypothetical protein